MNLLAGVLVLERAGALSIAACGHLLAKLGARVVRLEDADEATRLARASPAQARLRTHAKERLTITPQGCDDQWSKLLPTADVVLLSPTRPGDAGHETLSALIAGPLPHLVVCALSLAGCDEADLAPDASDALVQALGGLMAVTGQRDGPPEFARVPVAQLSAAAVATTAVLAALAQRQAGGRGQLIDLSLVEIMADQLRTHIGLVHTGQTRGFRIGCEHPLCSPWNAYRTRDGWILICSSGDAHWHALLEIMGMSALKQDARFLSMKARHEHAQEVDALIEQWVRNLGTDEAIATLNAIDVPVGPALHPTEIPADPILRAAGTVVTASDTAGTFAVSPWRFRTFRAAPANTRGSERPARSASALPLAGTRVIELTRYAAGPLAGYMLAGLGAEVIKIEPPGGEECRHWSPRFGEVSGYFINYNVGKRCIALDLRAAVAQQQLDRLIADADIVVHNMRPGAMERLGLGAEDLMDRHPRLIYAAISGFGPSGPQLPALDTVIQAHLGLTRLIGNSEVPIRVGYSIADQLAGHFLAAGIVAALFARERSGCGICVDVAMVDAIAWLTHLAWSGEQDVLPATSRIQTTDGWIVASASAHALAAMPQMHATTREGAVAMLAARGIVAAPVLEIDEVLQHRTLRTRASLYQVETPGGGKAPLFAAPLGMRVARPQRMSALAAEPSSLLSSKDTVG